MRGPDRSSPECRSREVERVEAKIDRNIRSHNTTTVVAGSICKSLIYFGFVRQHGERAGNIYGACRNGVKETAAIGYSAILHYKRCAYLYYIVGLNGSSGNTF